jgi:hypothetical protein
MAINKHLFHSFSQIMKAYTTKRSAKRARVSGTSSHGFSTTQNLHSDKVMDVFRLKIRQIDSVNMDDMAWEDAEGMDPIDISAVLDGEVPINLSHAGGEFYDMVEAHMGITQRQVFPHNTSNFYLHFTENDVLMIGHVVIRLRFDSEHLQTNWMA